MVCAPAQPNRGLRCSQCGLYVVCANMTDQAALMCSLVFLFFFFFFGPYCARYSSC